MKKVISMGSIKKIIVKGTPIILSILALVISIMSYNLSNKQYNEEYMDFDITNSSAKISGCGNDKSFELNDDCIILESKAISNTKNIKNIKSFITYDQPVTIYVQEDDNIELPLTDGVYFISDGITHGVYTYPLEFCLVNNKCTRNILQVRTQSNNESFRDTILETRVIDSTNLYSDLYNLDEDFYMEDKELRGSYLTETEFNDFFNINY